MILDTGHRPPVILVNPEYLSSPNLDLLLAFNHLACTASGVPFIFLPHPVYSFFSLLSDVVLLFLILPPTFLYFL